MTRLVAFSHNPMALAWSGWIALAATWLPSAVVLRSVLLAVFILWCPGAAFMRRWPTNDPLERAVLTVALSIAIAVIVAEAQAYAGFWHPRWTVGALALITTCGALAAGRVAGRKQA